MKAQFIEQKPQKAWVVFSGQSDLDWLKFLKPGFRHCFLLLNDGDNWISLDPLSNHTEIYVHHLPADFDLPAWMEKRGHRVLFANLNHTQPRPAPFMLFTCVEAVKRVLGLHRFFIFTPWQLYCHLKKKTFNQTNNEGEKIWAV